MPMRIAIKRLVASASLVAAVAAFAAGEEPFAGRWRLEGASVVIPEHCGHITASFVDGQYEGDDGFMVLRLRYVVEHQDRKFVLRFSYVSDDDMPNCQGMSAEFVRQHVIRSALIEMVGPHRLKMYFGEADRGSYLTSVRDE